MTDRREEERDRREAGRRREAVERRSDELGEAWRRNHPSGPGVGDGKRPGRGGA